ncbi:hypothetical protein EVAR_3851_1 [Eumeta japonica]|uniref:Uncharacterized protein n=1 Tax=Eumeta variegata TaxID=151549 RepID=A0A4C1SQG8_EUMVA|nr:hypothetical protein EVAR_3851_1 [Eumeta japonica]
METYQERGRDWRSRDAIAITNINLFKRAELQARVQNIGLVPRTKLCRSELAANDILRKYYAPQRFLLFRRVPILRHCDAFVTNFTARCSEAGSSAVRSFPRHSSYRRGPPAGGPLSSVARDTRSDTHVGARPFRAGCDAKSRIGENVHEQKCSFPRDVDVTAGARIRPQPELRHGALRNSPSEKFAGKEKISRLTRIG